MNTMTHGNHSPGCHTCGNHKPHKGCMTCGGDTPLMQIKGCPCVTVDGPVQVTGIANQAIVVETPAAMEWSAPPRIALEAKIEGALRGRLIASSNEYRREIHLMNESTKGKIWVGPTQAAVEARQGWPVNCGGFYLLENYSGPVWAAVDAETADGTAVGGSLLVNEFSV